MSQFFANIYLSYFDHWIKEEKKIRYYFRYADDIVILHYNKKYLHSLLIDIKKYMLNILMLNVKDNWQVFPVDVRGIDFVGYVFRHTHVMLRKSIKVTWSRRIGELKKNNLPKKYIAQKISCYEGWAKHCNGINLTMSLSL